VDGLVVPPRDAAALAALIGRLDDDRALLARLGAKAREKALGEFDERSVIQRTIGVYERLLGSELVPGGSLAAS
jgi:glycosyltransferase involved in cell wall biosynthesis